MVNGKQKGNGFERLISKEISMCLTGRDDMMWRTQNSGGRFTTRAKAGKETLNQEGDIAATSSETEWFSNMFYVECKHYKDINLWSMITGKGILIDWIKDYLDRSKHCNKLLFLVIRQNNKPIVLLTPTTIYTHVDADIKKIVKLKFYIQKDELLIFDFKEFLKNVKFKEKVDVIEDSLNEMRQHGAAEVCGLKVEIINEEM